MIRVEFGGDSNHNWLFLALRKHRILNIPSTKKRWNNLDQVDWDAFGKALEDRLASKSPVGKSIDEFASVVSSSLLNAPPMLLPKELVCELKSKRQLEKQWKTAVTGGSMATEDLAKLESGFLHQKR